MYEDKMTNNNIKSDSQRALYNEAILLYTDAVAKRAELGIDDKIKVRNAMYKGMPTATDEESRGTSKKEKNDVAMNKCHRNMCFELIETQINNAQPMPKITPMSQSKIDLAHNLEKWLRAEMDRLQGELINDEVERGVLKQGTHYYQVGWDDSVRIGNKMGGLTIRQIPIQDVWPQPGVKDFHAIDYMFVRERVSRRTLMKMTGYKDIPEDPNFKGLVTTITYWYYDDEGYTCRFVWVENTEYVLFDDRNYESRRVRVCKDCDTVTNDVTCPNCGSKKFTYKSVKSEVLKEDIVKGDPKSDAAPLVIAAKGTEIPYYALRCFPFVRRVNISDDNSMYGISDIDILETNQKSSNAVTSKIEQNILKAGSIVTIPSKMNFKLNNETLKVVRISDPKLAQGVTVQNLQANIQQDDILSEREYQFGRAALGITDSYQGKRDPTAESGKAKEIAAAQSAGRLESKRRMKDAAYADLYYMMFQMFLAYDDTKETISESETDGSLMTSAISRYDFLDGAPGNVYYDDSFLFSVDTASVLYTSREAMWRETTNNFMQGTMGDPAMPQTQMLYWSVMDELNYPLAKKCLTHITEMLQEQERAMAAKAQAIMQASEQMKQQQAQGQEQQQAPAEPAAPTQDNAQKKTNNLSSKFANQFVSGGMKQN